MGRVVHLKMPSQEEENDRMIKIKAIGNVSRVNRDTAAQPCESGEGFARLYDSANKAIREETYRADPHTCQKQVVCGKNDESHCTDESKNERKVCVQDSQQRLDGAWSSS